MNLRQHLQEVLTDFLLIIVIGLDDKAERVRCQNTPVAFIAFIFLEFCVFLVGYLFHGLSFMFFYPFVKERSVVVR